MTALNLTITPERAVLSQDTGMWILKPGQLEQAQLGAVADADTAAARTFIGDGSPPPEVETHEVQKITVLAERRLLIGVAGSYRQAVMWPALLAGTLPEGDVSEIAEQVPILLRRLVEEYVPDPIVQELIILHAGWSKAEGRVVGYAYDRTNNFTPVRLDQGHTMVPIANPRAPDYAALCELWMAALEGRQMEAFHKALLRNQYWSYRQGLLRQGAHLSSGYSMASVDVSGAALLP